MPKSLVRIDESDVRVDDLLGGLARQIDRAVGLSGKQLVDDLGLELYRFTAPTMPGSCSYEPSLLVVAQGMKRVNLGKATYTFGRKTYLLTSIELPVISQVASS